MVSVLTNSAHEPGHTCLTFSPDGKWAYTGGADSLVRIWRTDKGEDQEPEIQPDANEGITCLSASKERWLSGSEDSEVRSFKAGENGLEDMITSAIGVSVRCVAIDPKGKRVAVTSDELSVKLVDIEDNSKIILLNGHSRGVRKATWHPSGSLLTTSGSDGTIIVWDVSEDTPKQEKVIEGVIPAVLDTDSPEFAHDVSALWHPSGQYFFAATRTHEITTLSRPSYTSPSGATYTDPNNPSTGPVTALAVSPNGLYMASAQKGEVKVWSVEKKRVLWRYTSLGTATITHLAFSPTENLIAWTDTDGVLTRWPSPIPSSAPDPVKTPRVSTNALQSKPRHGTPDLFADINSVKGGDALDADGLEDDMPAMDDDWIIDDIGGGMEDEPEKSRGIKEMVSITKAQPAFQPGSTPMNQKKRYLAFNMIGAIEVTDQDTHHIVNVVFHDQSARKGYHFTDHFKYDLASLGERGILFACQPENDHPAQILYKPYTTWSSSSSQYEWIYPLKDKKARVLGLAAGGSKASSSKKAKANEDDTGTLVIATSYNDLTFLSGNKAKKLMMGLDGDFVSMVAGEEWLFFVHRPGATTIDGSQGLMGTLVTFDNHYIHQRGPLPISKGHTLKWIGITDEGAPAVYDSAGLLHVMANFRRAQGGNWVRVLDTNELERRQGDTFRQESYWPIGANQDNFSCIIVKGTTIHPGFPRPFPQDLPMHVPFQEDLDNDPKKVADSVLEEQILRETIYLNISRDALGDEITNLDIAKRELEQDKKFIKLINAACKDDKAIRAIEFVKELNHIASFDGAIKIAGFYRLVGLKEKIEILKAERERVDRREQARGKRRDWASELEPVPAPSSGLNPLSMSEPDRPHLLEDFRPPPAIHRPGLAPAIPVIETSRFSKANLSGHDSASRSSTPPEIKRKRDDESDNPFMGPPKTKTNPFARKPGQEANRNPFARKPDGNKTIQKSDSFFDKVDAAESDKGKRPFNAKLKDKEKKEPSRQSTLFGLPLGKSIEKQNRKKKTADANNESQSVEPEATVTSDHKALPYTQTSDITMVEEPTEEVETQPLEEQFESQNESQDAPDSVVEDQTMDMAEESIEWPPSPQAISGEVVGVEVVT